MFLKLGDLQGGSQDRRHPGEIEVLAWSWGASNSGLAEETTTGKARFLAVTFTKEMDRASKTPPLPDFPLQTPARI